MCLGKVTELCAVRSTVDSHALGVIQYLNKFCSGELSGNLKASVETGVGTVAGGDGLWLSPPHRGVDVWTYT